MSRTTTYTFDQGRLTAADYDKPSDALAAAALPGTIIFGAVNELSKAIQGRQGVTKDQADLLDAKAKVYTAQAGILDAKAKVIKAQEDFDKAAEKTEPASPSPAPTTQ